MKELLKYGIVPIEYDVLLAGLSNYQSPGDRISLLEKKGIILRLKKGLYVVSTDLSQQKLSRELTANHLYSPSYVSLESALSYYSLIPEKVYSVRSVTTKRAKWYNTPLGYYDYSKVPENYFSIGIRQEIINDSYSFLMATPEKAIMDMIVTTRNFRIQSVKAMRHFLEDDLRIELSAIESFNTDIINRCIETNTKKLELQILLKLVEQL
ncbi:MAG: hypothetical protein RBT57_07330 [Paludibacter sp.]|jgi:predicted transcriptional regulator of viral defense system|nr:hypothetical protein [Paludibacter sp.]